MLDDIRNIVRHCVGSRGQYPQASTQSRCIIETIVTPTAGEGELVR